MLALREEVLSPRPFRQGKLCRKRQTAQAQHPSSTRSGGFAGPGLASARWGGQGPTAGSPDPDSPPPSAPLQGPCLFLNVQVLVTAGVTLTSHEEKGPASKPLLSSDTQHRAGEPTAAQERAASTAHSSNLNSAKELERKEGNPDEMAVSAPLGYPPSTREPDPASHFQIPRKYSFHWVLAGEIFYCRGNPRDQRRGGLLDL